MTTKLKPCPFCGKDMMFRAALWPSEGDTDAVIHAEPADCPMLGFGDSTTDGSIIEKWNSRLFCDEDNFPSDGSCVRCGSVPRNENGLCNTCLDEDAERLENTRATPSAEPLAGLRRYTVISPFAPVGEYVLHSEAAKIVAELQEINKRQAECIMSENDRFDKYISKIAALEAELEQIKAQEPVAWMHPDARWTDVSKKEVTVHCKIGTHPLPLYAAPVSDSMKEENKNEGR